MPAPISIQYDSSLPERPAMVRQKTRDAFMAQTSHKQRMQHELQPGSTSLEVYKSSTNASKLIS